MSIPCRLRSKTANLLSIFDGLVKSQKTRLPVIPAKAGIQYIQSLKKFWTPFFNGVTTFYEWIIFDAKNLTDSAFGQKNGPNTIAYQWAWKMLEPAFYGWFTPFPNIPY